MLPIISTPIVSSEQWHEMRAKNVGASEVGALFGVHEFTTGYGLAARKLGLLVQQPDNPAMRRGRLLEPVAKQMLAELHPDWQLIEPAAYFEDPSIRFGATPDLFVRNERGLGVVQIKTVVPAAFANDWHKDGGTVEPPLWIALQAMSEQHLTGADFAFVAALVVGYGLELELVEVPYLPNVIESVRERVQRFWQMLEAGQLPPPDYGEDGKHLAQVYATDDGSEIDLTGDNELPEIVAQMEGLKAARKTADEGIDEAKAKILHRIGHATKAKFAGGVITAKTVQRKAYQVPASSYRPVNVKLDKRSEAQA